jgi:hypothetical protein
MARPPKDNLDYFPHDCRASSDEKLEILETKYPNGLGYSWYFKTLERIYYHQGFLDVSAAETRQLLCRNMSVIPEEIISYACLIGLFDQEKYENDGILTSKRIQKNVQPIIDKRKKMTERYQNRDSAAEIPPEIPPEMHIVEESKGKVKGKVEDIKHEIDIFTYQDSSGSDKPPKSMDRNSPKRFMVPDHLKEVWPKFIEMRKKIKKPMTDYAQELAIEKLEKLSNNHEEQVEMVKRSIEHSWQTFYLLSGDRSTVTTPTQQYTRQNAWEAPMPDYGERPDE